MADKRISISMDFNANTDRAKKQIMELSQALKNVGIQTSGSLFKDSDLQKGISAAKELQQHLQNAVDVNTGKLDLSRFSQNISKAGKDLAYYRDALINMGDEGKEAFLKLTQSIAMAEAPTARINKLFKSLGTSLANTIKWKISQSVLNSVVGSVQKAYGYAQDLNNSLTNIRIVTGQSVDEMAKFAEEANKAAKALSTTTTEYTNASLIYFQQGLSQEEVAARTETTIKLANVTGQSAQTISEQLTSIWNNFAKGGDNLEYYADVITKLGAATASSSSEIAEGLEKFAATAETVGLSYEYATAALATVTATTRESASVVGNAFKTLFSRLEGLKLGETLDDGTSLNKYSQALASVGVNIKTASGDLKDMDSILTELGGKWSTLSKSTQVALAQTVGGAKQYTQLIALMDEWEFFQENLALARDSEGALQEQADIYAEGWKAAKAEVTAALEDIYSSLIDEEGLIKLTHFFSKFLDSIAGAIDGFGGFKNIVTSVGSILLSIYAKEMPDAINNLVNNFKSLFGIAQKNTDELQKANLESIEQLRAMNPNDKAFNTSLDRVQKLAEMNNYLLTNQKKLSAVEQERYRISMSMVESAYELLEVKQKEIDISTKNNKKNFESSIKYDGMNQLSSYEDIEAQITKAQENVQETKKYYDQIKTELEGLSSEKDKAYFDSYLNEQEQKLKLLEQEKKDWEANKEVCDKYSKALGQINFSQIRENHAEFNKAKNAVKIVTDEMEKLAVQQGKLNNSSNSLSEITKKFDEFKKGTTEAKEETIKLLNSFKNDEYLKKYSTEFDDVIQQLNSGNLDGAKTKIESVIKSIGEDSSEASSKIDFLWTVLERSGIDFNSDLFQEFINGLSSSSEEAERLKRKLEELKNTKIDKAVVSSSESFTRMSSSLMSIYSIGRSATSTFTSLFDNSKSGLDKVSAAIGGIIPMLMTISTLSRNIGKLQDLEITKETAKNVLLKIQLALKTAISKAGLSAGAVAAGITLLLAAIGAVIALIKKKKQAEKEAYEQSVQNAKDSVSKIKEEQEAIESLTEAYEEALAVYQQTGKAKEDFIKQALEMADAYEIEGANIDILLGKYDELIEKINKKTEAEKQGWLTQLTSSKDSLLKDFGKNVTSFSMETATRTFEHRDFVNAAKSKNYVDEKGVLTLGDKDLTDEEKVAQYEWALNYITELENSTKTQAERDHLTQQDWYKQTKEWLTANENLYTEYNKVKTDFGNTTLSLRTNQDKVNNAANSSYDEWYSFITTTAEDLGMSVNEVMDYYAKDEYTKEASALRIAEHQALEDYKKSSPYQNAIILGRTSQDESNFKKSFEDTYKKYGISAASYDYSKFSGDWNYVNSLLDIDSISQNINKNKTIRENIKNGLEKLKEDFDSTDWENFETESGISWGEDGIISYENFLGKSYDEKQKYLKEKQQEIENSIALQIKALKDEKTALEGKIDSKNGAVSKTKEPEKFQEITNRINLLDQEIATQERSLTYINLETEAREKNEIETAKEAKNLKELHNLRNKGTISDKAYTAGLVNLSKKYTKCQEALDDYNEAVRTSGEETEEAKIKFEELETALYISSLEEMAGKLYDLKQEFDNAAVGSLEYQEKANSIVDLINDFYGTDLGAGWVEQNKETLNNFILGTENSVEDFITAILSGTQNLSDLLMPAFGELSEKGENAVSSMIQTMQEQISNGTFTFDNFQSSLTDLVASGQISAQNIQDAFSQIGIQLEPKWEWVQRYGDIDGVNTADEIVQQVLGPQQVYMITGWKVKGNNLDFQGRTGKTNSKTQKTADDENERYYEISRIISKLQKSYNELSKAKGRAYGKERLKNIEDEIELLNKEKEAQQKLLDQAKAFLSTDESTLKSYFANYSENPFNSEGIVTQQARDWLAQQLAYAENSDSDSLNQWAEKAKNALSQYDETLQKVAEVKDSLIDLNNQVQDLNYEKITYKIELRTEINENDLQSIEMKLESIGDNIFKAVEKLAYIWNGDTLTNTQYNRYIEQLTIAKEAIDDVRKAKEEGLISDEVYISNLNEQQSAIVSAISSLRELKNTMESYYSDIMSSVNEELEKYNSRLEHSTSILQAYKKILDLTGYKADYEKMGVLLDGIVQTSKNSYQAKAEEYKMWESQRIEADKTMAQYEKELAEAQSTEEKEIAQRKIDAYKKTYDAIIENSQSAYDAMISSAEAYAEAINEKFENAITKASKKLEDLSTNGLGYDGMSDSLTRLSEISDEYLTKTNQLYETTTMLRNITKDISKTQSASSKTRLNNFAQEIKNMQQQSQLSQLDLKIAKARYSILQAQIALEEAKEAKSTVRRVRDSEGNYGYVYTTDLDKISQAEQNVADAENELYNLSLESYNDYAQKILQTRKDYAEAMAELERQFQSGEIESIEEYNDKKALIQKEFGDKLYIYTQNFNTARGILNETALTDYNEAYSSTYDDILSDSTIFNSNMLSFVSEIEGAQQTASDELKNLAEGVVEPSLEGIKNATDEVTTSSNELLKKLEGESGLVAQFNNLANTVHNSTLQWIEQDSELQKVITDYENLYGLITEIKAQSIGLERSYSTDGSDQDYSALMMQAYREGNLTDYEKYKKMRIDKIALHGVDVGNATTENIDYVISTLGFDTFEAIGKFLGKTVTNWTSSLTDEDWNKLLGKTVGKTIEATDTVADTGTTTISSNTKDDSQSDNTTRYENIKKLHNSVWSDKSYPTGLTNRIARAVQDGYTEEEMRTVQDIINKYWPNKASEEQIKSFLGFASGGYTGEWGDSGKLAILHQKELVLNAQDTENILTSVNLLRSIIDVLDAKTAFAMSNLSSVGYGGTSQSILSETSNLTNSNLDQSVTIHAEFPNATNHSEIEQAFDNLINEAAQYAFRHT